MNIGFTSSIFGFGYKALFLESRIFFFLGGVRDYEGNLVEVKEVDPQKLNNFIYMESGNI